eukprot:scaffold50464_cov66-Phaeocystis_antarctica.AAC.1
MARATAARAAAARERSETPSGRVEAARTSRSIASSRRLYRERGCTGRPPTCLARCGARIADCRPSGALRLHGAAPWREVARGGLRAPTAAGEVGGAGVRAFLARQRRAGTLGAERARLAGDARLLALVGLVLAGHTLVARTLACDGLGGAGTALGLPRAAHRCIVARASRRALVSAAQVSGARVRALAARQRRRRALRAVRARHAGVAIGPAGLVHELACGALVALVAQPMHGTRAAWRRIVSGPSGDEVDATRDATVGDAH